MYDTTKPYNKQILSMIKETWQTSFVSVEDGIVKKKFSFPEYHHTDGIGSKGIYHWQKRTLRNAVLDAFAMNANDLAMVRAKPYALIDHIMIPHDDNSAILSIIENLVYECKKRDIAITGGETAVHTNMEGLEISITMLGFIPEPAENKFQTDDLLLGIKSNGLHSNGFTKVREIFGSEYCDEFIEPTAIYLEDILDLNERFKINGMMHITGGAFTKLKGLLENNDVLIKRNHLLQPHPIFNEIYKKGVSDEEMYKTFNCGIGFIFSMQEKEVLRFKSYLYNSPFKNKSIEVIGKVKKGKGNVKIESMFSKRLITL